MKIKRIIISICLALLLLFFNACASGNENESNDKVEDQMKLSFSADWFIGKRVVVYGDSITHGVGTSDKSKTYIDLLSKQIGFSYNNFAVSGSLLTYVNAMQDGRESGVEIITEQKEYNQNADYAIILYGANDSTHRVFSTTGYEASPNGLNEVSTFKQGIEYAVKTLRQHNKDIIIIFLTPILRTDNNGFSIETLNDYTQLIMKLSSEYDYYYFDLYPLFTTENFSENSAYTSDGCHPNDEGNRLIYQFLLDKELNGQ